MGRKRVGTAWVDPPGRGRESPPRRETVRAAQGCGSNADFLHSPGGQIPAEAFRVSYRVALPEPRAAGHTTAVVVGRREELTMRALVLALALCAAPLQDKAEEQYAYVAALAEKGLSERVVREAQGFLKEHADHPKA